MANWESVFAGVVTSFEVYTYEALARRTGLAVSTLRGAAAKKGLRVHRLHRKVFVRGDDWLDYVFKSSNPLKGQSEPDAA